MRMFEKSKAKEMHRLRAAGLSLAHADRVARNRSGHGAILAATGAVAVVTVGLIAALMLKLEDNGPTQAATAAAVTPSAPAALPTVLATPAPASFSIADEHPVDTEDRLKRAVASAFGDTNGDQVVQVSSGAQVPSPIAAQEAAIDDEPTPSATTAVAYTSRDCVARLDSFLAPLFVQFDLGSTQITPDNARMLQLIGEEIAACEDAFVMVSGHADSSGDDATNMALSWERADRTLNRLVGFGVNPEALEAVGFGARAPLSQGSDEEDGADRRVDFRVLRIRGDE